jgi:hypothetical protein
MDSDPWCDCGHFTEQGLHDKLPAKDCVLCGKPIRSCAPVFDDAFQAGPSPDFEPPKEIALFQHPDTGLYSLLAVFVAGAFGGILGAALALGSNFSDLRRRNLAVLSILFGIVAAVVSFLFVWDVLELPTGWQAALPLATVIIAQIAIGGAFGLLATFFLQRRDLRSKTESGKPVGFEVPALRLGCICGVLLFGSQILWNYPIAWGGAPPMRTAYFGHRNRLVYSVDLAKEKIVKTAAVLSDFGAFPEHGERSVDVFVSDRTTHVEVRLFVDENAFRDNEPFAPARFDWRRKNLRPQLARAQMDEYFQDLRDEIAKKAFTDVPVRVVVCGTTGRKIVEYREDG